MYDEELSFGEFILERRKKLDMTGRELANKLSISAVYLCDIEKGRKAALTSLGWYSV
jgi:transcriptional regulator with XRE-family HTH domain